MLRPVSMQKLVRATFITSLILVIILGAIWGTRFFLMRNRQTTTPMADNALVGFPMTGAMAPDFHLVDQFGHSVTLSSLRGHEVVLAFIDSQCTTLCPLTATIMYNAKTKLGSSAASRIDLVAVNANPAATSIADVQSWSIQHGMLHQWTFLTGTARQLQSIYSQYKVYDQVNTGGQVVHDTAMFIIDASGHEQLYFETLDSSSQSDLSSEETGLEAGMRQWLPQST